MFSPVIIKVLGFSLNLLLSLLLPNLLIANLRCLQKSYICFFGDFLFRFPYVGYARKTGIFTLNVAPVVTYHRTKEKALRMRAWWRFNLRLSY